MKRIFALFAVLCIALFAAMPAFAESAESTEIVYFDSVHDNANVLSDSTENQLEEQIHNIRQEYNFDIIIYTCTNDFDDATGRVAWEHAENTYKSHGFSGDGVMLMIYYDSDNECKYLVYTSGKCKDIYNNEDMLYIEERINRNIAVKSDSGLYTTASTFVDDCKTEFAVDNFVVDDAYVFKADTERKIKKRILEVKEKYGCDICIYTHRFDKSYVSDDEAREHAENFYISRNLTDNGVLFMIFFESDNDGGTHITTSGKCRNALTEDELIEIEDNFYSYLTLRNEEGYYKAAISFIDDCEDEFEDYDNFDGKWFLISPGVGALVSFFAARKNKNALRSVKSKHDAADYTKAGSLKLTTSSDVFLYKRVTKVPKPRDNGGSFRSSGGGGRSFGGHSGRRF